MTPLKKNDRNVRHYDSPGFQVATDKHSLFTANKGIDLLIDLLACLAVSEVIQLEY